MPLRDDPRRTRATLAFAVVVAAVLHVGLAASIPRFHDEPVEVTQLESEFVEVIEDTPPPAPEPEPEAPPPEPAPPVHRAPVVREARAPEPRAAPPPRPEPAPAAQETPVDFDGVVLGGDNSSFTVQQASGNERGALIGTPGATVTGRSRQGTPGGVPGGTGNGLELVPAMNLRRRPTAPGEALNGLLQRNYPEEAKRQGISGRARVAMVLDADGRVRRTRIVRESPPGQGFGAACRRTLLDGPAWEPALGPDGRPAATEVPFDCNFDVHQ